ncbi:MAG TPA: hypothetical protein VKN14_00640 [Flavobacteriaceae bacterium]|nr:hypothetical protein [Flavobacteriaceae bacterium]
MDFLENLEGFDDWFLQEGYNLYMRDRIRLSVRKGIPRRPEEADDIIRWALARKDYVKYAEWLKTTYGSNWRGTFQSLVAQSNRINLSNAEKEAIDKLFTKGLLQFKYDELKKAFQLHRQTAKTRKKALDWAIDPKNAALVDALK